ncbi:MAG: isoprenyl transferase [Bacteroidales bacterium]|jgi:undecaprenyl diphosphate synthase|nr:isoprenyl transferase [Bacteroidales bacterium]
MLGEGIIDKNRIPKHVAIIMDGNGRWAKMRGLDRSEGHRKGTDAVRATTEAATELKIAYLTLYTFSTENWNRPKEEIDALMNLLVWGIEKETPDLMKNNIRLLTIGAIESLPDYTQQRLLKCIEQTAQNTGLSLVLALSYSARSELVAATRQIAAEVSRGNLASEDIDEQTIAAHLSTKNMPDPDLLIRTGGEFRISNFLLWQLSYSELYFTNTFWPDFGKDDFVKAILDFQNRERRFGKTSEQL